MMTSSEKLTITLGAVGTAAATVVGIAYACNRRGKRRLAASIETVTPQPSAPPRGAHLAAVFPLPMLPDGRLPRITSHHHTRNPSRSTHDGVDWFYPVLPGDPDWPTGDGGGTSNGRWIVPPGTPAIAVNAGTVQQAGVSKTGHYVWIDHGLMRTGYFHLTELFASEGERIQVGQQLGLIGDNPADHDARHLHFELSATKKYDPVDPVPYLGNAAYLPLADTIGPIRHIEGIEHKGAMV